MGTLNFVNSFFCFCFTNNLFILIEVWDCIASIYIVKTQIIFQKMIYYLVDVAAFEIQIIRLIL